MIHIISGPDFSLDRWETSSCKVSIFFPTSWSFENPKIKQKWQSLSLVIVIHSGGTWSKFGQLGWFCKPSKKFRQEFFTEAIWYIKNKSQNPYVSYKRSFNFLYWTWRIYSLVLIAAPLTLKEICHLDEAEQIQAEQKQVVFVPQYL